MAKSSPEGIELGKGSQLVSMELSINKEKVLSIESQKRSYSEEDMMDYSNYCLLIKKALNPKEWFKQFKNK